MTEIESRLPDIRLRPYIRMYFWGRDPNPPLTQRVVPNGEMGLMFYCGSTPSLDGIKRMRACVKGQSVHYHDIISNGCGIEIAGVHFTALGARILLAAPLHEFFENTVELSDMDDAEMRMLERQVAQADTHQECWTLFDDFFLHRLAASDVDTLNIRRLHRAIAYSQWQPHQASVDELAAEACLSTRQFRRLFSDMIGMSPKDYMRIQRYHATLQDIKLNHGNTTLSDIAWRNGYYDLSHLNADFRLITGHTPKSLIGISRNDNDNVGWRI